MTIRYPLSDHCDGEHFFNPGPGQRPQGFSQVLRWRLTSKRSVWPKLPPDPVFPLPPDAVADGTAAVTFVNHATFLIQLSGTVILTDPIFSERCSPVSWAGPKRARPPGIALADLKRPDIVLLSHNHYDHMDLPTLRVLQRQHAPRFITTLGNAPALARIGIQATELDWWQMTTHDE